MSCTNVRRFLPLKKRLTLRQQRRRMLRVHRRLHTMLSRARQAKYPRRTPDYRTALQLSEL